MGDTGGTGQSCRLWRCRIRHQEYAEASTTASSAVCCLNRPKCTSISIESSLSITGSLRCGSDGSDYVELQKPRAKCVLGVRLCNTSTGMVKGKERRARAPTIDLTSLSCSRPKGEPPSCYPCDGNGLKMIGMGRCRELEGGSRCIRHGVRRRYTNR